MCQVSQQVQSLLTDAEFCFLGGDLRRFTCWCPISTCVQGPGGAHCEFTTLTITVALACCLVGCVAVGVYVMASSALSDIQMKRHRNEDGHHRYRDVLFGVYHASEDHTTTPTAAVVPTMPTEKTPLTSGKQAAQTSSGGGTFT